MNEPHWLVVAVIGAILGLLLPYMMYLLRFLWRYRKSDRLEKSWFEYHATFTEGRAIIVGGTWHIKKGFRHRLVVTFQHEKDDGLKYKGVLHKERGHILAVLASISDDEETLYYRFVTPVGSQSTVPGLWLSYDRDGRVCAGSAILSQEPLEETAVGPILSNMVEQSGAIPALRVKK